MVLLWFGILGIRLSATNSLSHETLWIRRRFIQSWLVRIRDLTWYRVSWFKNFHETDCNYFWYCCLHPRYRSNWLIWMTSFWRRYDVIDQVESLYSGSRKIWPWGIFGTSIESCSPIGWSWSLSVQWCQSRSFLDCFMFRYIPENRKSPSDVIFSVVSDKLSSRVCGCIFFTMALMYKQMELYHSFAFFFILIG